jgi:uncharacterized repeat protein (TIGR03803 family)
VTAAGKLTSVYSFCSQANCADGKYPTSGPILGSDGIFYGVVSSSGNSTGSGTFYKLTPGGKLTTLYTFCPTSPCADGQGPTGVIQASNGNFYGTTYFSGKFNGGTIFQISSVGKFKLLYSFCSRANCVDGANPSYSPIQASNGDFYGATQGGGTYGHGVVYQITPAGTYKVLYNFCSASDCSDGYRPTAIVQDANGNLFGTTFGGGSYGWGTVFEITPANQYVVLHSFDNKDGAANPIAGLTLANDGNLYGTTQAGFQNNGGTIFEITPAGVFTPLYTFCNSSCITGANPEGWLFQGTDGILYGNGNAGGSMGYGTVFRLSNGLSPLVETVPVAGKVGEHVIILGNGLTGSTSVTFNSMPATFTVVSDTEITATVPSGATTGTVSVVTPSGTLNSNPQFVVTR